MSAHHPALRGKIVRALPGMLDTDNSVPDYPAETWAVAAPKRAFAAPIAVGTIDQALLSNRACAPCVDASGVPVAAPAGGR